MVPLVMLTVLFGDAYRRPTASTGPALVNGNGCSPQTMEYITDLRPLVSWMASVAAQIILSYEGADGQSRYYRRKSGWVNDYTNSEVRELLRRHGLSVVMALGRASAYMPKPWTAQAHVANI
jgi:hypothetical protein